MTVVRIKQDVIYEVFITRYVFTLQAALLLLITAKLYAVEEQEGKAMWELTAFLTGRSVQ